MKNLLKTLSLMTVGSVIIIALNLITIPIYLNNFSAKEYGFIILFQSSVLILQVIINPFTWQSVVFVFDSKSQKMKKRTNYVIFQLSESLFSLLILATVFLIIFLLDTTGFNPKFLGICFFAFLSIFLTSSNVSIAYLRSQEKFGIIVYLDIIKNFIRCITAFVCVLQEDLFIFYLGFVFSNFVSFLGLILASLAYAKLSINKVCYVLYEFISSKRFHSLKEFRKRFFYIWMKSLFDVTFNQLDKILVGWLVGISEIAVYEIAKRFAQGIGVILNNLNYYYYPKLVRAWGDGTDILKQSFRIGLIISIIITVFITLIYTKIDILYNFSSSLINVEEHDWLFIFAYLGSFMISSAFMFVHLSFQITGYLKSDIYILIFGNSLFFIAIILFAEKNGLWAFLLAFLLQNIFVLASKVFLAFYKP
ncbi:hypothetical protein N9530_02510 [Ascidiaceihabitans sp.]|nr:hypothetical protein [Ascidiaceihabitans sp.]